MIKAENVTFEYDRLDEEGNIESKLTAVDHLSLKIESGSFIAVLASAFLFALATISSACFS